MDFICGDFKRFLHCLLNEVIFGGSGFEQEKSFFEMKRTCIL
jgi:hypothetical protein